MNEVMQIIESNKNAGSGTGQTSTSITLNIDNNIVSSLTNEGETTTYKDGGNMMNVLYKNQNVADFQFYIHTLVTGGKFTLNATINHGDSKNGTLEGVSNSISDVYEVYYYRKDGGNQGALKIKTSSDAKIFHKENVNNGDKWTEYTSTSNAPGDLGDLVTKIKEEVEIKVEILLLSLY